MKNKILLVDDEKVFLTSLKEGLEPFQDVFYTDICFSVDEATELVSRNDYSLIITDIRMPKKTGIDLLLYLKNNNFKGIVKVMSAHEVENEIQNIKGLGAVEIISKPFHLGWFQKMLIDFFENENSSDILFESISLISVLQIINIEKKSSILQIDCDGVKGLVFFDKGEIVSAEYEDLSGKEALMEMLLAKEPKISMKKIKKRVKKNIDTPFTGLIMNMIKIIDEGKKPESDNSGLTPIEIYDIVEQKKGLAGRMELVKKTGILRKEAESSKNALSKIQEIKEAAKEILGKDIEDFL